VSIEIRNVTKRFGSFLAVDDVSLEIPQGSLTAVLGPSGSGKSTLLRIVAGLERPDAGEVLLAGEDATRLTPQRRNVGFVFQHYAAFKHMTVYGNVAFGLEIRKRPKAEIRKRVTELLELVHLEQLANRYPAQLSGGQRQRVAIARALVLRPRIVVCDEPTSALDVSVQAQILNLLAELRRDLGLTYLFISHNLAVVEHIATEVAVMYLGRFVEQAPVDVLFRNPRHPYTRALLASVLTPEPGKGIPDVGLGESYPDPANIPSGCRFHPRSPMVIERCRSESPDGIVRDGRLTECLRA
jgi:peptide/nickel transport system ATP-binding protein